MTKPQTRIALATATFLLVVALGVFAWVNRDSGLLPDSVEDAGPSVEASTPEPVDVIEEHEDGTVDVTRGPRP